MTPDPTPLEAVWGYTLAAILGAAFWTWVGVATAAGLAKKAFQEGMEAAK